MYGGGGNMKSVNNIKDRIWKYTINNEISDDLNKLFEDIEEEFDHLVANLDELEDQLNEYNNKQYNNK